jgi:hypothetical protein
MQAQHKLKLAHVKPSTKLVVKASVNASSASLQLRKGRQSDGPEIQKIIISEW